MISKDFVICAGDLLNPEELGVWFNQDYYLYCFESDNYYQWQVWNKNYLINNQNLETSLEFTYDEVIKYLNDKQTF